MAVAKWRWDWQLDRLGFGTADETVNTPAGAAAAAADEAVAVAVAEARVFGNICCCQHIFHVAPVAVASYLLATVSVSLLLLLLYNNFDDGRYGTRRFGWVPVTSPCWKLRWISLLLTVECVHNSCRAAKSAIHTRSAVCFCFCRFTFSRLLCLLSELNCLLFNNIALYDYVSKCLSLVCCLCTYVSFYLFITVLHTVLKWRGNTHTRTSCLGLGLWLLMSPANASYKF